VGSGIGTGMNLLWVIHLQAVGIVLTGIHRTACAGKTTGSLYTARVSKGSCELGGRGRLLRQQESPRLAESITLYGSDRGKYVRIYSRANDMRITFLSLFFILK
jgi:hypothetical protein